VFAQSKQRFKWKKWYGIGFHKIRKIIARIRKMMKSHFPMAHASLPINPRITHITAKMMNSIPSAKSQPNMFTATGGLFTTFDFIICVELFLLPYTKNNAH
jgi:hypothetical protein